MAAVQNHVVLAGFSWSTHHVAQTEKWFEVWSHKAARAAYIIVIFCDGYRGRFTPALKQEADYIQRLHDGGKGIPVYVFDSQAGHRAAEVESNLRQGAQFMGNFEGWRAFVNTTTPVNSSAASTTPPPSANNQPEAGASALPSVEGGRFAPAPPGSPAPPGPATSPTSPTTADGGGSGGGGGGDDDALTASTKAPPGSGSGSSVVAIEDWLAGVHPALAVYATVFIDEG